MKKTFLPFVALLAGLAMLTSCNGDDDTMVELPQIIEDYIASNYPAYSIDESEEETLCDGTAVYEVELEDDNDNEIELTFDSEGSFLFSETEISTESLPDAVSSSIASNYANYSIEEAERQDLFDDTNRYQVEIKGDGSELEVLLEADGTVICEEEDSDG